MPRDTRTRYQGVYARHKQDCLSHFGRPCNCVPSYWGKVYDRATGKERKTRMVHSPTAARTARNELEATLRRGSLPASNTMRVKGAIEAFERAIENGTALNKRGRPYKPSSVRDLRGAFDRYITPELGGMRLVDVRRGDVQRLVDKLTGTKSGSTVRTVVNAIHSLYEFAKARELVNPDQDPAKYIRLPAMNATPRDRVLLLDTFDCLLATLSLPDVLPYALAGGVGARRNEIRHLRVDDVDLGRGVVYLGEDERGRKSAAARRAVPVVANGELLPMLRRQIMRLGRQSDALLCPGEHGGLLSVEALQVRVDAAWAKAGLERVTLHECRHMYTSWLDAAGVRDSVIKQLVGHAGGERGVTMRYTHTLPDDLERARELMSAYIDRVRAEAAVAL